MTTHHIAGVCSTRHRKALRLIHAVVGSLCVCISMVAPSETVKAQATPFKYLSLRDQSTSHPKQYATDIQLATLTVDDRIVPIVAVREPTRIIVHWWHSESVAWRYVEIAQLDAGGVFPDFQDRVDTTMARISSVGDFHRVGLATGEGMVFVAFRRWASVSQNTFSIQLQVQILTWQDGRLIPTTIAPTVVPLNDSAVFSSGPFASGHYFWLGYDAIRHRVVLLAQLRRVAAVGALPSLSLITGRVSQSTLDGNICDSSTVGNSAICNPITFWSKQVVDDTGGYGLQARQSDQTVTFIHGRTEYSTWFDLPNGVTTQAGDLLNRLLTQANGDLHFADLVLGEVNLGDDSVAITAEDVPGGDNPRIQSLNPLVITTTRLSQVRADFAGMRGSIGPDFGGPESPIELFSGRLTAPTYETLLIMRGSQGWRTGLVPGTYDRLPRIPSRLHLAESEFSPFNVVGERVVTPQVGFQLRFIPDAFPHFLVGMGSRESDNTKLDVLQFMVHEPILGLLVVNEYEVSVDSLTLSIRQSGTNVYDINHAQIASTIDPGHETTSSENVQFGSFRSPGRSDAATTASDTSTSLYHVRFPEFAPTDNTIGGHLTVDTSSLGAQFFAYTDLGDGMVRVVFDLEFPPPDPTPVATKLFDPGQVHSAFGAGDSGWVTIEGEDEFLPSRVPAYSTARGIIFPDTAIHSSIEPLLDAAIQAINPNFVFNGGSTITITEDLVAQGLARLQQTAAAAQLGRGTTVTPSGPILQLAITPAIVQTGEPVTLIVSFPNGDDSISGPVVWNFGNGVETTDTTSASRVYEASGAFVVSAQITQSSGEVRSVTATVTVLPVVWGTVWGIVSTAESQAREQTGIDVTFDQFHVSFAKYDAEFDRAGGTPRSISVTLKPEYDTAMRFRGSVGQGEIDYAYRIGARSESVSIGGLAGFAFSLDSIDIVVRYVRTFTPGILAIDHRAVNPLTQVNTIQDAPTASVTALAAKPTSAGSIASHDVSITANVSANLIPGLVEVLFILGLVALGTVLAGLFGSVAAALAAPSPWAWIAAAVITFFICGIVFGLVPDAVESVIENEVRDIVLGIDDDPDDEATPEPLAGRLNRLGFARYGGEGLAEALALDIVRQIANENGVVANGAQLSTGRSRMQDHAWEMVVVTDRRAKVLVRKSALVPGGL